MEYPERAGIRNQVSQRCSSLRCPGRLETADLMKEGAMGERTGVAGENGQPLPLSIRGGVEYGEQTTQGGIVYRRPGGKRKWYAGSRDLWWTLPAVPLAATFFFMATQSVHPPVQLTWTIMGLIFLFGIPLYLLLTTSRIGR